MKLKDCDLTIGVIVSVEDETHQGRIKCIIPGVVNDQISEKNSPWVRPLYMGGYQTFSKEMVGSKVWVLINNENYNEYWYFPFFELNNVAMTALSETYDNDQPEIFLAHDTGGNNAISMYDEVNGFRMMCGENNISLKPDGHVNLTGNDGEFDIDGSQVKMGKKGGSYEKAVLGEKLMTMLNNLKAAMNQLLVAASSQSFTTHLTDGFQAAEDALNNTQNILSDTVQLN